MLQTYISVSDIRKQRVIMRHFLGCQVSGTLGPQLLFQTLMQYSTWTLEYSTYTYHDKSNMRL